MPERLIVAAVIAIATGALYLYVGSVVSRRRVEGDAQLASKAFSAWWMGLGAVTMGGGIMNGLAVSGWTDLAVWLAYTYIVLLVLCIALWGLLYYLVYLFTGSRRAFWPVTVFYLGFYGYLVYFVTVLHPIGVQVGTWNATIQYEHTPAPISTTIAVLLLIAPHVLGALAYASLYFRVETTTQRYRIGMIAGTILAWFGSSLVVSLTGSGGDWWQFASRAIGIAAAFGIYFAFRPPAWVRARYGVQAVDEGTAS